MKIKKDTKVKVTYRPELGTGAELQVAKDASEALRQLTLDLSTFNLEYYKHTFCVMGDIITLRGENEVIRQTQGI